MMRRLFASLLLCGMLSFLPALPAGAHSLSLVAAVSLSEAELTVRVMDAYRSPSEGARVVVVTTAEGDRPGSPIRLIETAPGTYTGQLRLTEGATHEVVIDVTLYDELYRAFTQVHGGESFGERLIGMMAIEEQRFPWGWVLYGMAAIVLATATAVALLKRRVTGEEDE
jgi:hypothetical protein